MTPTRCSAHRVPHRRFETHYTPRADALEPRRLLAATGAAIAFDAAASFTAGTNPIAIVAADFNGDGNTDLAVADRATDKVSVFYGAGNGTFTAGPVLTLSGAPSSMVVGDFDGNGYPDLAVATSPGAGGSAGVSVFLNTAGTFSAALSTTLYTGGSSTDPVALAVGKFNGSTYLDLAATDYSQGEVLILTGNDNGTFAAPIAYATDAQPTSIVAADFNGDGLPDLAVAATQPATAGATSSTQVITLLEGQSAGTFAAAGTLALSTTSADVLAAADLNNDGLADLVVGSADGTGETLLNAGSFGFSVAAVGALPGPASAVAAADLNFDGDPDVIFADGNNSTVVSGTGAIVTSQAEVSVIEGNGDGTFASTGTSDFATAAPPVALAIGDFNNDGKLDIAAADEATGQVSILLNTTAGTVLRPTTTTLAPITATPSGEPVTLTAAVTTTGLGFDTGQPIGTVNFYSHGKFIGSAAAVAATAANAATAAFTTSTLAQGTDSITATYTGSGTFAPSNSAAVSATISVNPNAQPELVGTLLTPALDGDVAPGETETVRIRVTNQGDAAARGTLVNALVFSAVSGTNQTIATLGGTLGRAAIHLAPQQSVVLSGTFIVPALAGEFSLAVNLDSADAFNESNPSLNQAVVASDVSVVNEFGTVGSRARVPLVTTDANGTPLLCRLSGPGTGTFSVSAGVYSISLAGTTAATTVTLTADVAGKAAATSPITLTEIDSTSPIGTLAAPALSLTGNLTLAAARRINLANLTGSAITIGAGPAMTLSLGAVTNSTLAASAAISTLSCAGWTNSSGGISAPSIGSLTSRGPFDAALSLTGVGAPAGAALRTASFPAGISGGIWSIGGTIGRLSIGDGVALGFSGSVAGTLSSLSDSGYFSGDLAAANFGSILIRGALTSGDLLAGTGFGANGIAGGGDDTFAPGVIRSLVIDGAVTDSLVAAGIDSPSDSVNTTVGDTLLSGGAIKAITIKGAVDSTSKFLAASLPAKARIDGVLTTTASDPANFSL